MEKKEIVFDLAEPKKHSICFKTTEKDAPIQSVYLMRTAFGAEEPKRIKITVEEA